MNNKKTITLLALVIMSITFSIAQVTNVYISKTELNSNPSLEFADVELFYSTMSGSVNFTYVQNLSPYKYDENEPVRLTISLLNVEPETGVESLHGAQSEYFDWMYDGPTNSFLGVQNKDFYEDFTADIEIDVTVTNAISCEEVSKMGFNANIQPAPKMNGTNITEDDSVSDYGCLSEATTSTEEIEGEWIKVSPNPFFNEFKIERLNQNEELDITIYNASGKLVKIVKLKSLDNNIGVDLGAENPGVYVIHISDSKSTQIQKLIKVSL